jgi:phosphatidylglycerophosphatase C
VLIVTASPEIVVAPIARALGADQLIGTRLAFDEAGRVTGELDGLNCRGPEKVRRLREAYGEDVRLEAAYGDTDGDTEMLALAEEQGLRVFNGKGRG